MTAADRQALAEELAREWINSAQFGLGPEPLQQHVSRYILKALDRALGPANPLPPDALSARIADVIRRSGVPDAEQIVRAVEVRTAISREAAEVVAAAEAWVDQEGGGKPNPQFLSAPAAMEYHAVMRLRALRETAARETCGATTIVRTQSGPSLTHGSMDGDRTPPCSLHRNHDGKHRGSLGDWEWE